MPNKAIITTICLISGMIFTDIADELQAEIPDDVKIEHIYTKPWYDQYQYSFKIFADNEPIGPYKLLIHSDIDSNTINGRHVVKPNSWVQWFTYIDAEDPDSIKVKILPSNMDLQV